MTPRGWNRLCRSICAVRFAWTILAQGAHFPIPAGPGALSPAPAPASAMTDPHAGQHDPALSGDPLRALHGPAHDLVDHDHHPVPLPAAPGSTAFTPPPVVAPARSHRGEETVPKGIEHPPRRSAV